MEVASIVISVIALTISATTAWLTLLRRGTIRMTQPTLIFFGPDGATEAVPKVYLRTLLYSTAKRGQIVENMFLKLRRNESVQNFNIWVYGDRPKLSRGSGLFVGENGVVCDHHFLLPRDGNDFQWRAGEFVVETFATLVGSRPILLNRVRLTLTEQHASAIRIRGAGVFFDWGPDSSNYHSHLDERPRHSD